MTFNVRNALAQRVGYPNADAILSRFDVTPKGRAQEVIDTHMRKIAHRVMDVFQGADEDALADDVMTDVFTAIGLTGAFGAQPTERASQPVTEEQVRAGAFVIDEGAMDSPEDYPIQAEAALTLSREVLEAAREAGR